MRQLAPWLLVLIATSLGACPKKSPPESRRDNARSPDQASETCATDRDCVLTVKRLKSCCVGCGLPFAVHRSRAAAIGRWHRQHCKPGTFACPKVDCKQPPGTPRARCLKRKCVTEIRFQNKSER